MGIISEACAMRYLNRFLKTDTGKAKIAQARKEILKKGVGGGGLLSKEIAFEIAQNICDEVREAVRHVIQSFRVDSIHANLEEADEHGFLRANISVDEDALHRASLHYVNRDLTIRHGDGVDDIVALFTHGYTLNKRPYGFWVRSGGRAMSHVGALMHRDPNPFLQDLAERLNEEYRGRCTVTLNDKYRMQAGG